MECPIGFTAESVIEMRGIRMTPHLHLLLPEAQWQVRSSRAESRDGEVVPLPPPTDEEVTAVLARVLRQAKKDWAELDAGWADDEYEELQQRAIRERLGLADVQRVRPRARRLAVLQGFSLHADTAVHGHDRQGLERLCRYGTRGPVAVSRLRRLEDGRYEYVAKEGVTFTLTPEALVRRLVALVPPPRRHLTSFHGVYAPHAALRPSLPSSCSRLRLRLRLRLRRRSRSAAWIGPRCTSAPGRAAVRRITAGRR